jgi:hypothetical protein
VTQPAPLASAPEPGTPAWWVDVLYKRLTERREEIAFYDDYYRGDHPLPWLAPQARDEFRRILRMTRSNYMGLVVDAKAERMQVEGFRVAGEDGQVPDEADAELARIWQANNLDSDSDLAWTEALVAGDAYMLVAPNAEDPKTPLITIEHASQVVMAFEPGTNRRRARAGLKVWVDEWAGDYLATLYLPDGLWKLRADPPKQGVAEYRPRWTPRTAADEQAAPNPLGEVPLRELTCTPRLLAHGRPFLSDVTDVQDRINKTIADRLMTQDFGAFPQKWAAGWPDEDANGNPQPKIEVGRDRMVTSSVSKQDLTFGQWDAAPLDPYSSAKREDVKDIASRTRTPAQDLLGEMNNVNGETIKASQSGHIAVVKQFCRHAGDRLEGVMRLAQKAAGLPQDAGMETIWANPEYRTEGEVTDAIVKRLAARITSLRQAREDYGYSTTQIKRLEQDDLTATAATGLGNIGALFTQAEADAAGA